MKEPGQAAQRGGEWLVLAAAVLWGTTGTAQAFAPPGATPLAIGALRLLVGSVALLAIAALRGEIKRGSSWSKGALFLAAGCMAAYQLCFFAAVLRSGVALGALVAIGSAPVIAGAFSALTGGERPGPRWLLATGCAILGCALLLLPGNSAQVDRLGVLLALGAGGAYATYALSSKGLLKTHPPDAVVAVVFCLGALFLSPVLLLTDLSWLFTGRGLGVVLHLGLVATAAAYTLFARGLQRIPAATALSLSLAEPLTAAALGIFLLGEPLTPLQALGMGLIFGGLVLLSGRPRPR